MNKSDEKTFTVTEETLLALIDAIANRHNAEHRNCDYEVCDDPVCAAGWKLEQETAVFEGW